MPECQKLIMVFYTSMALNTLKCNHLAQLGLKGLNRIILHISVSVSKKLSMVMGEL